MDDREGRWAGAMRAARRGDAAAYRGLLAEIAAALRGMTRARLSRMGLSPDEAEDVVQETLIALHAKRHTWDEDRPFLPWLHAIARYRMIDAARRLGRVRARTVASPVEDLADLLPAPAPREGAALDRERLVAALPGRERGVVAALGLEGMSVTAAARRFAISEGAVRVAFHRGLTRLRTLSDRAQAPGRGTAQ